MLTVLLRLVVGLLLGLSVGLGAVVWNSHWWGVLLSAAATFATAAVLPGAARVGFTIGWLIPVVRAAVPTAAGDLLLFADLNGYLVLLMGFVLAVATMLTTVQPKPRTPGPGAAPRA